MRFLGRRFLAAAVGVIALGSVASAQSPVGRPVKSYRMAMPGEAAPAPVIEEVTWKSSVIAEPVPNAPTQPTVTPVSSDVPSTLPAIAPAACTDCAATTSSCEGGSCSNEKKSLNLFSSIHARLFSPAYGYANPVTCGTCKSEKTFFFGSCCQFFQPGRECGSCGNCYGCGDNACGKGGLGYWHKCPPVIYGPGTGVPMNPCVYDSYLNH